VFGAGPQVGVPSAARTNVGSIAAGLKACTTTEWIRSQSDVRVRYSPKSPVRGAGASSGSTKYSMSRSSSSSSSVGWTAAVAVAVRPPGSVPAGNTRTRCPRRRRVVGCDVVELSPMPGNAAPNFLCAKLLYKILSYRFGKEVRAGSGM
jgi:hypothetical protein